MKITRILITKDHHETVVGTKEQIRSLAHKIAHVTGQCVTVAVVVGHYHRRGCETRRMGGYQEEGN